MFPTNFDQRRLLVVNPGGTLVPGPEDGRRQLKRALQPLRRSLVLVYVSGRSLDEEASDIETHDLPPPDYVISALGTEIHRLPGGHPLPEWERYVQPGFEHQLIHAFIAERFPKLELQPIEHQTPLKVSYFWPEATQKQLERLRRSLLEADLPATVKLVYSHDLYLDVIPARAGHGPAVKFLVDSLMLAPGQVYICGDSGSDIDLFQYGFHGIVPGHATYDLREAVQLRAYFSHQHYAAGLLEGLHHYNFFRPHAGQQTDLAQEAFERAISSLHRNITPLGFSAAGLSDNPLTEEDSNYFAVWSRDGIKSGLWTLSLNDPDVTECFRRTLELMAEHQTENGQIPANVQIKTGIPDYGGIGDIASIDSVLWFVIGSCRYAAYTGDRPFLERIMPKLDLAMEWLHAHDSNNCGLLEVPESSDWMDLFPRSYNVLYDEVLWFQACQDMSVTTAAMGRAKTAERWARLTERIRRRILRQFWPTTHIISDPVASFAETQFTIGNAQYLLAQLSPFGFSWRCDVYANLLACLMGLLSERQMKQVFQFLWGVGVNSPFPVKCLYPSIQSGASDWRDYIVTNLLNLPEHYHNGGIWPFIGGLWVRFLAQIDRKELAHRELNRLAEACRLGIYEDWEFNEWLHGQTGRPMGKAHQTWTAAGYIAAYQALRQESVPVDFEPLRVEMFEG